MASLNTCWARAIVQELRRSGVRHAVVCPGSRSTPLALACAEEPGMKVWSVVDERTAGFFALGMGLATGMPAVLVATSGTASAHFYPAVIEALASRVPLVVLSADRPWELHGFGAAQTIEQGNLFGAHTLGFWELGVPEASSASLVHLRAVVCQAVARARGGPPGPVHLNAPFREPLAPNPEGTPTPEGLTQEALEGRGDVPFLQWHSAPGGLAPAAVASLAQRLASEERGVIVCGPRSTEDGLAEAVTALSRATGYPVLAEAASQARFDAEGGSIALYDLLLRHPAFARAHRPGVVLRIGGGLTSKRLTEWLEESRAPTVLFAEGRVAHDPSHRASEVFEGNTVATLRRLAESISRGPGAWLAYFQRAQARARTTLEDVFERQTPLSEPRVAYETARALPSGSNLFIASSMPIRDVDAFAPPHGRRVHVFSNRGVNGIDGTLSSALGVSVASGRPTVVLTGDLAFLHDLNGLLIARRHGLALTVVLVDNDGGGIFSFLPVAKVERHFEELFGTPHGVDFQHAASLMGARYSAPRTAPELRELLRAAPGPGVSLVHVRVDRHTNPAEHQALYRAVQTALEEGSWTQA